MKTENLKLKTKNSLKGQATLVAMIFFLLIFLTFVFGFSFLAIPEARIASINLDAKQSYFLSEAGVEDVLYRMRKGLDYSSTEVLSLNGSSVTTNVVDVGGGQKQIVSQGDVSNSIRKVMVTVKQGEGVSFHYGVQVGDGGLFMKNTSQVNGNVYANGNITGQNSPTIAGDAISAGTISNPPTVTGTRTEGASPLPMPIPDEDINLWETDAAAGGTISSPCPYYPPDGSSLGPVKITCDVIIDGTKVITLTGPVWITGNLDIKNSAELRLDSSYGPTSEAIVVDNPANRTTSSKISVQNSAQVLGSGTSGSYVLLISQNNSAELGGGEIAIEPKNSSNAPVYYAPHGKVSLENSTELKEVTAYAIHMKNSATLTYETGLINPQFLSGPSGGWEIESWKEIE